MLSFRVKSSTTNERDTPKNLFISDRIEAGAEISKRNSLSIQEMLARHITRSLRDFMEDSTAEIVNSFNFNSQSIRGRVPPSEGRDSMTTLEKTKIFVLSAILFSIAQALLRVLDEKRVSFMPARRQKIIPERAPVRFHALPAPED